MKSKFKAPPQYISFLNKFKSLLDSKVCLCLLQFSLGTQDSKNCKCVSEVCVNVCSSVPPVQCHTSESV